MDVRIKYVCHIYDLTTHAPSLPRLHEGSRNQTLHSAIARYQEQPGLDLISQHKRVPPEEVPFSIDPTGKKHVRDSLQRLTHILWEMWKRGAGEYSVC